MGENDTKDWKDIEPIVMKNFAAASGKDVRALKMCDCNGACDCPPGGDVAGIAGGALGDFVGSNE